MVDSYNIYNIANLALVRFFLGKYLNFIIIIFG